MRPLPLKAPLAILETLAYAKHPLVVGNFLHSDRSLSYLRRQ
jgi:hypothetical protein